MLVLDGAGWHVAKDLVVPEGIRAYFGESARAFRLKPPTISVISPTLPMGLVGGRRRDPSFSPYAGIACRAKGHDDDEDLTEALVGFRGGR